MDIFSQSLVSNSMSCYEFRAFSSVKESELKKSQRIGTEVARLLRFPSFPHGVLLWLRYVRSFFEINVNFLAVVIANWFSPFLECLLHAENTVAIFLLFTDLPVHPKSLLPLTWSPSWGALRSCHRHVEFRVYIGRNAYWWTTLQRGKWGEAYMQSVVISFVKMMNKKSTKV